MKSAKINGFRRIAGLALAAVVLSAMIPVPSASAQGLFEALFGGSRERSRALPPQASSFADPFGLFGRNDAPRPASSGGGGGTAYCVRTCDGRFFPLQRNSSLSPAELCKSFCPAARTAVYSGGGGQIDNAVAPGAGRYSDMENAFVYRTKIVDNCTCNGKDAFGLARLDVAADPTLKQGDIVATNEGLATYRGKSAGDVAQYTPIKGSAGEWARRLAETKVMPMPAVEKVQPVAEDTTSSTRPRRDRRNVQLVR